MSRNRLSHSPNEIIVGAHALARRFRVSPVARANASGPGAGHQIHAALGVCRVAGSAEGEPCNLAVSVGTSSVKTVSASRRYAACRAAWTATVTSDWVIASLLHCGRPKVVPGN